MITTAHSSFKAVSLKQDLVWELWAEHTFQGWGEGEETLIAKIQLLGQPVVMSSFYKNFKYFYLAMPGLCFVHGIFNLHCGMQDLFSYSMRDSCGMYSLSCGMWDLVPWPEIEPGPPALGIWHLSHWTTREVPVISSWWSSPTFHPSWLILRILYIPLFCHVPWAINKGFY